MVLERWAAAQARRERERVWGKCVLLRRRGSCDFLGGEAAASGREKDGVRCSERRERGSHANGRSQRVGGRRVVRSAMLGCALGVALRCAQARPWPSWRPLAGSSPALRRSVIAAPPPGSRQSSHPFLPLLRALAPTPSASATTLTPLHSRRCPPAHRAIPAKFLGLAPHPVPSHRQHESNARCTYAGRGGP